VADERKEIELDRMVARSYRKALSLNWDKIAEATIEVYASVLAKAWPIRQPARFKKAKPGIGTRAGDMWKYSYS
jgi:hypothetical protein